MQQFQVPQFITVEDKVIGPLTIKQFLYIAPAALLIIAAKTYLQSFLFWPVSILAGGIAAALAFLKINGRPLPIILKNAAFFVLRPKLYIWKAEKAAVRREAPRAKPEAAIKTIPKLSASKISDLAWSLDIKEELRQY